MIKEAEVDPDGSLTRRWAAKADEAGVKRTMAALEANGITVLRASDAAAAKLIVLDLIPDASPVHQGASQTLDVLGITNEIEKSGRYGALRPRIWSMDRETEADEIRRLGAAPDVMLGSVHAVTETGSLLAASMSGSQLGPYVSGAGRVILVVGTQKIVPDLEQGLLRINEYAWRLEDARAQAAYGIHSAVNKVGIIGVSPVRGWATTAHIPALRALPNYEIRALSAHSAESARAVGQAFAVGAVFSDHEKLVTQPDIDLVAVTVKVPHHRELVSAALAAGKAVYCEWPLGRDLDDARAVAALAAKQGVRTVVGLQARQAPAIEFVQQLLRDGYVGKVLSTTMVGLSIAGDVVGQPNAYMLDKANGANLLTVPFGHSLDILNYVLGEFADLSAVSDVRRPLITIEETGEKIVKTAPDQVAVIGTLKSGATASVHIREAVAGGTGFLWEINGTDGTLRITADAALPEIFPLTVAGAQGRNELAELAVPTALTQKWPTLTSLEGAPAFNVARAYAAFAADIDNGTHTVPDFADAVRRHEVIAAIERSAASGERVKA